MVVNVWAGLQLQLLWVQIHSHVVQSIVEQYLIAREKRLFKGFEDYNQITRLVFDLETTSLEPENGNIFMIGIKTNKGYHRVIECIDEDQEKNAIIEFFKYFNQFDTRFSDKVY